MTGRDEAIKFSGGFDVKTDRENVFDFLTDPGRFAVLLKDPRDLTVHDSQHFKVKLKLGILFIKGTADVEMELADAERPKGAIYKGNGVMAGETVTMVGGFELTPMGDESMAEKKSGANQSEVASRNPTRRHGLDRW